MSIIEPEHVSPVHIRPTHASVRTATGEAVTVLGACDLSVTLTGLRRTFVHCFLVCRTRCSILGSDFLSRFGLDLHFGQRCVRDTTTGLCVPFLRSAAPAVSPIRVLIDYGAPPAPVLDLLRARPSLTALEAPAVSGIAHKIETTGPPVVSQARQLHPAKLAAAKRCFDSLLSQGIIAPSDSPWSSPLHMAPKDGPDTWRPCGDYRALNSITKPDRYPVPNVQTFTRNLYGCKFFSSLDLVKAYHQIAVDPADVPKTAVITPFGLFHYLRMPFGLKNSSCTFQRFIDAVLRDCPFAFAYIDDVLIASPDEATHLNHVRAVLDRLAEAGLRLSPTKCRWFQRSLDFLGHTISEAGILPKADRVAALADRPPPTSYSELRSTMGMLNYYRRHVPRFAELAEPLHELLRATQPVRAGPRATQPDFVWTDIHGDSLRALTAAVCDATLLHHPSVDDDRYVLVTDASAVAVGAALHVTRSGVPVPLAFHSRTLTTAERKWATFDRELLAVHDAIRRFRHLLEGRVVTVFTDHKPLVAAFAKKSSTHPRQHRHLSFLAEFVDEIVHVPGAENVVADALSRPPTVATDPVTPPDESAAVVSAVAVDAYDLASMAEAQALVTADVLTGGQFQTRLFPTSGPHELLCDTSTPYPRPVVPETLRRAVFDDLHNLGHPGPRKTVQLVSERFVWPGLSRDVKNWCGECTVCQQAKSQRNTKSPVQQLPAFSERFANVHVDIVGPLPAGDYPERYIATYIDRGTNWVEADPLTNITANDIAESFVRCWFTRFGVPLTLTTDRGGQFESEVFSEISRLVGFQRIRTAAYHPQSNGKIERFHRTLKAALRSRPEEWKSALPLVLFAYRIAPHAEGPSPFELLTGLKAQVPRAMIEPPRGANVAFSSEFVKRLRQHITDLRFSSAQPSSRLTDSYVPKRLTACEFVWVRTDRVRRPLEAPYTGPYPVISRNEKTFVIDVGGSNQTVSIDRLRPACVARDSAEPREPELEPPAVPAPDPVPVEAPAPQTRPVRRRVAFRDPAFDYT